MRISDWSSDVCSSDLIDLLLAGKHEEKVERPLPAVKRQVERLRRVARRGEVEFPGVAHAKSGWSASASNASRFSMASAKSPFASLSTLAIARSSRSDRKSTRLNSSH